MEELIRKKLTTGTNTLSENPGPSLYVLYSILRNLQFSFEPVLDEIFA